MGTCGGVRRGPRVPRCGPAACAAILSAWIDARRTTAFSFRRQRLDGSAPSALEAPWRRWSACTARTRPARCRSTSVRRPRRGTRCSPCDADRATVRMRAMRTSGFVVPRSTAPLVRAATAVADRAVRVDAARGQRLGRGASTRRAPRRARRGRARPSHGPGAAVRAWTSTALRDRAARCRCSSLRGDLVSVGLRLADVECVAVPLASRVAGGRRGARRSGSRRGARMAGGRVPARVRAGPGRRLRLVVRAERPRSPPRPSRPTRPWTSATGCCCSAEDVAAFEATSRWPAR